MKAFPERSIDWGPPLSTCQVSGSLNGRSLAADKKKRSKRGDMLNEACPYLPRPQTCKHAIPLVPWENGGVGGVERNSLPEWNSEIRLPHLFQGWFQAPR
ncbi:hypothetical protein CDAR_368031 [Caerostris darwini]|uniref:Prolactin receptor n=1 Tax=Caerostris darwini TaxID=1538125 RepID=A0AAV4UII6_9ARAC|nr:hypothetical protein CDAR_368031 [Caerostris darwini]